MASWARAHHDADELRDLLRARIRDVPDYPQPGIVFKDITPILADPVLFSQTVADLGRPWCADPEDLPAGDTSVAETSARVDKVVGIEARGFILAAPVALALGVGFVPVRKKGKLPADTYEESYTLEYGEETLEVHRDAFRPGEQVLIVDDVLATGGTVEATARLLRRSGAEVAGVAILLELGFLSGRDRLDSLDLHVLLSS